jgi:DNA repair exonuclease SbcCD ATPase subunit
MTNVGKIFTVVVFIMSIFFMMTGVMVLATHKNWRDDVLGDPADPSKPGMKKQLADAELVNQALRKEIEELKKQIAQEQTVRRLVIGSLRMKLDAAEGQVRTLNDQLAKLTADQGVLTATLQQQQQNLDKFTNETMALREAIKTAQEERDSVFLEYVSTLENYNQANTTLSTLEERSKMLADELALRREVMNKLGVSLNERTEHLAQDVKGEIREVSGDKVVISVGFDDGVRVGQLLEVYTKTAYRGKVRIIKVEPDKAVGEIVPEYTRGRMQRGDSVANKIS